MTNSLYRDLTYYLRSVGFCTHHALKGGHPEKVYDLYTALAIRGR